MTARWALAGTSVHDFNEVLEVLLPATAGSLGVPVTSQNGTNWRSCAAATARRCRSGAADGFYRDAAGVHVLTRHLSYFAFFGDMQAPTPPLDVAGVVAADGLTLRWSPGTDDSGELGNVVLLVNGEPYASFAPTQLEVKMGAFGRGRHARLHVPPVRRRGQRQRPLRSLARRPLGRRPGGHAAAARLAAAGFKLGKVDARPSPPPRCAGHRRRPDRS